MDAWEHSAEVTLMGGLGPVEKGWDAVSDTLSWVGGKFGDGGAARIEHLAVVEGADLGYTVGYEHRTTSLDGGEVHERTLRVTHIYRRSPDGQWHIVHRHADYAQPDPRRTS
jgi:ketosteroid isomerase-like protein